MQIFREQLIAAAAKTEGDDQVGADFEVLPRAVVFVLDVTKADGTTPTLNVRIESRDPVSGKYFTIETFTEVEGVVATERKVFTALHESVLRVAYDITAATADYDFTVSVQGKEGDEA